MYPVSDEYKVAVKQITRTFQLIINVFPTNDISMEEIEKILATVVQGVPKSEIKYSIRSVEDVKNILATIVEGVETPEEAKKYVLYDSDVVTKTFKLSDNFVTGEDIEFGNAIAKDLAFTLTNYEGQWNDVNLERATVIPMIGLLTESGYEYVPMGTFWVDEAGKPASTVTLKALDGMARFGVPFAEVNVGYPCDLKTLFFAICDHCGTRTKVTSFTNDSLTVQQAPENIEDYTCRDMLAYIAMLAGSNARMSRDNYLELVSFGSSGECSLEPVNRTKFVPEDYRIRISGFSYTDSEDVIHLIGNDSYMLDLPTNPLMPKDPSDALNALLDSFEEFVHQPFSLEYFGDPSIDCGDKITNIHSNGKTYNSYVTNNSFTFKGPSSLSGKGRLPEVYSSPTKESQRDKKIVATIRKYRKEAEQQFSTLEQSIIQATNFMTQELGGYVYKTNNALYVMDTQDLETAKKLWKWGLGGFGYSANGKEGPFTSAITMDGQIVADFITAGTMSGERIQAGTITADSLTKSLLLAGDRISIQSTNFTLDWDGSITCNDATLYGDFTTDIATIDNDGVNVYYGCLNVFKGSKSNPGAYALHIEPYYTLINGGFQSSDFGMSMAVGALLNTDSTDTYSAHFLLWDNKTNTMNTPIIDIYRSTSGYLCLRTGEGVSGGIMVGNWDFDRHQKFTKDVGTTGAFQLYNGNTLVGNIYQAENNLVITNSQGNVQLGVSGYNFIRGHREHGYSKAIIYNYDLRAGSDIIVDYTKVGSTWWESDNTVYTGIESGYQWGVGVGGKYRITATGNGGKLWGAWDFSQDQIFSYNVGAWTFEVRRNGTLYGNLWTNNKSELYLGSTRGTGIALGIAAAGTTSFSTKLFVSNSGGELWGTWYLGSSTPITSDANLKNSIENLPEKYIQLVERLRPVIYKYNDGTSGRYHTGLIAQDVAQALNEVGIDTQDFAGYVLAHASEHYGGISEGEKPREYYALRYEEFIGPLIAVAQQLLKRVSSLEAIIQGGEGNGSEGQ